MAQVRRVGNNAQPGACGVAGIAGTVRTASTATGQRSRSAGRRGAAPATRQELEGGETQQHGRAAQHGRDALGEKGAQQAAQRAGAGNLAEARFRGARVEALAGNQPEPGRQQRSRPRKRAGRRSRPWSTAPSTWTSHSPTNSTPLATKEPAPAPAGAMLARSCGVCARRAECEHTEVAMSIVGSAVTSSEVRNRASRVALPRDEPGRHRGRAEHRHHHRAGVACHLGFTAFRGRRGSRLSRPSANASDGPDSRNGQGLRRRVP